MISELSRRRNNGATALSQHSLHSENGTKTKRNSFKQGNKAIFLRVVALTIVLAIFILVANTTSLPAVVIRSIVSSITPPFSNKLKTTFDGVPLYTPQQLYRYANKKSGRILLGLAGSVYDVSHGKQHYGREGGYPFFAGRDATRSFVTGDFKNDLNDDISDFTPEQHSEVLRWREFYEDHKHYTFVGRVIGRFYDESGHPTDLLKKMEENARDYRKQQKQQEAAAAAADADIESSGDTLCDVSWNAAEGGWVHCEQGSYPRRVEVTLGTSQEHQDRCFCFDNNKVTSSRALYDGCSPDSNECQTSPPDPVT